MRTVALDIDGVLRDIMGEFVMMYNVEQGEERSVDQLVEYDTACDWCGSFDGLVSCLEAWGCFLHAPPYDGAAGFVNDLRKFYKVVYVTAQTTITARVQTLEWLEQLKSPPLCHTQ